MLSYNQANVGMDFMGNPIMPGDPLPNYTAPTPMINNGP